MQSIGWINKARWVICGKLQENAWVKSWVDELIVGKHDSITFTTPYQQYNCVWIGVEWGLHFHLGKDEQTFQEVQ